MYIYQNNVRHCPIIDCFTLGILLRVHYMLTRSYYNLNCVKALQYNSNDL